MALAPRFTPADFLAAAKALLPRGRVWRAAQGGAQHGLLSGLAANLARLSDQAADLLADAFPATAVQLLPEWEAALGLPDPCAGESPTLTQRQAQVVARLTAKGGQSKAYFVHRAALLGYTISIVEHAPFRFGRRFGRPFGGEDWAHAWTVVAPLNTVTPFRFGASGYGEPFAAWGNAVLECELAAVAPAHTILKFSYV